MFRAILIWQLRYITKKILKKYRPDIIGITGSIGKSSTKEATEMVLRTKFNIRSSYKNYNNEIGVPLAIIGVTKTPGNSIIGWLQVFGKAVKLLAKKDENYPEILVLEMGSDKPGDISYLTDIAPCKVGVLTYIAHAHTEAFKTIKKIAQEKRIILSHLKEDGFAVLNFDNELVMQNAKTKADVLTYGFNEGADFQATDINVIYNSETNWPTGINFKVNYKNGFIPVMLPGAVAIHLVPSALAALTIGHIFGVNLIDGASALKQTNPLPGHMCLISGIKNTLIIDDSYNSSPDPTKYALKTLSNIIIKQDAKRIAVLGDMLELGPETENFHKEIGELVYKLKLDVLITVGEASKHTIRGAREAGMNEHKTIPFADSGSAGRFLQDLIKPNDVILVKGSQGVRMERIVKELMANPLEAKKLLVRQTDEWEKSL